MSLFVPCVGRSFNLTFGPRQGAIELGNRERGRPGRPRDLASKAMSELPWAGVVSTQIQNGVILTRLEIQITARASVEPSKSDKNLGVVKTSEEEP